MLSSVLEAWHRGIAHSKTDKFLDLMEHIFFYQEDRKLNINIYTCTYINI